LKKNRDNILFLLGNYYSFFVIGIMVLVLGAIMPYLLRDYQLSYDQGGTLIMLQALGNLIATVMGGIISVYTGRRATLVFGALTIAAGYGGMALVSSPAAIYVLVTVSGLGWGIMNNLTNVVVSEKTKGDASALNILHMSFGLGALIGPFLVSLTVAIGLGWRTAMTLVAAFSLILAYVFMRMDLPEPEDSHETQEKTTRISFSFLRDVRFYNFMLILFLYVGSESVINGWLTTYILDTGIADEYFAQRLLSFTWFAVIAGRLGCAWLSKYSSKEVLLLAGGLGSLLFTVLFLISKSWLMVYIAVLGLGLSFSGIYPNTVANAAYLIHGSTTASGIMFSLGGLGASLIPYIVGLRAESSGIGTGMNTLIAATLLLALFCIINLIMGVLFKPYHKSPKMI
jgi:FHS family glucose/mannose:H+ symporter-like MFS transporter